MEFEHAAVLNGPVSSSSPSSSYRLTVHLHNRHLIFGGMALWKTVQNVCKRGNTDIKTIMIMIIIIIIIIIYSSCIIRQNRQHDKEHKRMLKVRDNSALNMHRTMYSKMQIHSK